MAVVARKDIRSGNYHVGSTTLQGERRNGQIMKLQNIENVKERQQTAIIHGLYEALTC